MSDNAPNFTCAAMAEICQLLSNKTRKSYAYKSNTNGKIEIVMKGINEAFFGTIYLLASPQANTKFSPFFSPAF